MRSWPFRAWTGFLTGLGIDTTVMVRSVLLRGFDQDIAERIGRFMQADGTRFIRPAVPRRYVPEIYTTVYVLECYTMVCVIECYTRVYVLECYTMVYVLECLHHGVRPPSVTP